MFLMRYKALGNLYGLIDVRLSGQVALFARQTRTWPVQLDVDPRSFMLAIFHVPVCPSSATCASRREVKLWLAR
jgi:hypothetical protein